MHEFWLRFHWSLFPVASFTKEVDQRLAKRPLVFNGRLPNGELTSLIETVSPEGTFCDTVQVPSNGGDMELI